MSIAPVVFRQNLLSVQSCSLLLHTSHFFLTPVYLQLALPHNKQTVHVCCVILCHYHIIAVKLIGYSDILIIDTLLLLKK